MNNKGFISVTVLIILLVVVAGLVGGLIYYDSTKTKIENQNNSEVTDFVGDMAGSDATQQGQQVTFIPYQSADQLFTLQIPDFWVGEERAGAVLFYSYDPAGETPEQKAKIEIARAANPDNMTAEEWLTAAEIDFSAAQIATLAPVQGLMLVEDNTEENLGDIKSTIYLPVNDQMFVVTATSEGQYRDVAIPFFNAILNSWQWLQEITTPSAVAITDQVDEDNQVEGNGDEESENALNLNFDEARAIAMANNECSDVGILSDQYNYNESSNTWWFDLERAPEEAEDGCNPACVVFDDTQIVEVNWRCTGALEE
ncbi:MAG: hypothetical protein ABH884_01185 [Candidatus Komeilibacteria bacterium]